MPDLDAQILDLYVAGHSYREIIEMLGCNDRRITKNVKGMRSPKEAAAICKAKGKGQLTEAGRARLSESGKKATIKAKKFWTKPEQDFKAILNEIGLGVRFPEYVKIACGVEDDPNPTIFHQYPLQRYVCDFVDVERRIVFRINGDFWHANPILYDHGCLTKAQAHNVKQDKNSKIFFEKNGWIVCDVWESEIRWSREAVKAKIGPLSQLVSEPVLHAGSSEFESREDHLDWSERLKSLWFKERRTKASPRLCRICGEAIKSSKKTVAHCSMRCSQLQFRKAERPTKEQLQEMVWNKPVTQIAKQYGVTDNAVKKWLRSYSITDYPTRGYWQKAHKRKSDGQS